MSRTLSPSSKKPYGVARAIAIWELARSSYYAARNRELHPRGHAYNGKYDCLYEHPGDNPPRRAKGVKLSSRRLTGKVVPQRAAEVQHEG